MNSSATILILHFKDSHHTQSCLDSLAKTTSDFTPYILSIQSTDSASLRAHPLQPVVIDTETNGGFAWANNVLLKRAAAEGHRNFILLNNDTTVDPGFISPLLNQLKQPGIAMVCPKIYFSPGLEFHHDSYTEAERGKVIWYMGGLIDWANVYASHLNVDEVDHGQFQTPIETDFATGCCLAINQDTIEKIGYMNEKYFLYYEDTDWSLRAKQAGLKLLVEPQSIIYHHNAGSTGGSGSSLQQYYQTRNRLYFGLKFAPLKTKLSLIKNGLWDLKSSNRILRQANRDGLLFRLGRRSF